MEIWSVIDLPHRVFDFSLSCECNRGAHVRDSSDAARAFFAFRVFTFSPLVDERRQGRRWNGEKPGDAKSRDDLRQVIPHADASSDIQWERLSKKNLIGRRVRCDTARKSAVKMHASFVTFYSKLYCTRLLLVRKRYASERLENNYRTDDAIAITARQSSELLSVSSVIMVLIRDTCKSISLSLPPKFCSVRVSQAIFNFTFIKRASHNKTRSSCYMLDARFCNYLSF